jgi:hypothetical protein
LLAVASGPQHSAAFGEDFDRCLCLDAAGAAGFPVFAGLGQSAREVAEVFDGGCGGCSSMEFVESALHLRPVGASFGEPGSGLRGVLCSADFLGRSVLDLPGHRQDLAAVILPDLQESRQVIEGCLGLTEDIALPGDGIVYIGFRLSERVGGCFSLAEEFRELCRLGRCDSGVLHRPVTFRLAVRFLHCEISQQSREVGDLLVTSWTAGSAWVSGSQGLHGPIQPAVFAPEATYRLLGTALILPGVVQALIQVDRQLPELLLCPVVACAGVMDAPRRQVRDPTGVFCCLTCGAQSGQTIVGVSPGRFRTCFPRSRIVSSRLAARASVRAASRRACSAADRCSTRAS